MFPSNAPTVGSAGRPRSAACDRLAGARGFHHLLSLAGLVLLLSSPAWLGSCGGESEPAPAPKKAKRGGAASSRTERPPREETEGERDVPAAASSVRERATAALAEAEEIGAADLYPEDFSKAEDKISVGQQYLLDGDVEKANREFRLAASALGRLVADAKELKEALQGAEAAQKNAEEARVKATEAKAEENAKVQFQEAVKAFDQGVASLQKKELRAAQSARSYFNQAALQFSDAAEVAGQNAKYREMAALAKEAMEKWKAKALEKKADETAMTEWQYAERSERQGLLAFGDGDFQQAAQQFDSAASQYTRALKMVADQEEMNRLLEEQRKRDEALLAAQKQESGAVPGGFIPPPPPSGGALPLPPDSPTSPVPPPVIPPSGLLPTPGVVSRANCFQFNPGDFPNEIDDEDELFLQEHILKLSSVATTYDPQTGLVMLDYSSGRRVKDDLDISKTPNPKVYIGFEDPFTRGVSDADVPEEAMVSFNGNTQGFVFFHVPFIYKLRITWNFNIAVMKGTGTFGCMFCLDPKKQSYWGTDFINIIRVSGGTPRGTKTYPDPKLQKNANYWHDKTRTVPWVVEFQMPDPDKASKGPTGSALITATYDAGGSDEATNKLSMQKTNPSGVVGFYWKDTKFTIRGLKICGILDKKKAVAMLREKLGIPKGSETPASDEPEPGDPGEDPTAPEEDDAPPPVEDI
ncbi:MAG: hypothetical protein JXA90_08195 [Planctomycetes bacterium]|nr:hypothetical protein [Planctomycetota bacterium]